MAVNNNGLELFLGQKIQVSDPVCCWAKTLSAINIERLLYMFVVVIQWLDEPDTKISSGYTILYYSSLRLITHPEANLFLWLSHKF